jgi:hypothetical protein
LAEDFFAVFFFVVFCSSLPCAAAAAFCEVSSSETAEFFFVPVDFVLAVATYPPERAHPIKA